jgi:hypothetical protein
MTPPSEDERTVHRQFDTEEDDPVFDVVETIAELEGKPMEQLPSLHATVDDILEHVFSEPPAPEAQVEIGFTYAGYRIKLFQDGRATFLKVA